MSRARYRHYHYKAFDLCAVVARRFYFKSISLETYDQTDSKQAVRGLDSHTIAHGRAFGRQVGGGLRFLDSIESYGEGNVSPWEAEPDLRGLTFVPPCLPFWLPPGMVQVVKGHHPLLPEATTQPTTTDTKGVLQREGE